MDVCPHDHQHCCARGPAAAYSDALLLKQMPKKQTGFALLLKQNKSDLVFHDEN